jgi:CheY-like chemotaxis protein
MMPDATAAPRRPIALIVDDEATIRHRTAGALQATGFQTEEADDGPPALAVMARLPPDLVFLDVRLPSVDVSACVRRSAGCRTGRRFPSS